MLSDLTQKSRQLRVSRSCLSRRFIEERVFSIVIHFHRNRTAMASRRRTECPVCFSEYDPTNHIPKFLSCGHTFCINCLKQLWKQTTIMCPTCKQQAAINNVASLPTNFLAIQDVDDQCQECDESQQTKTCTLCSRRLCDDCESTHVKTHAGPIQKDLAGLRRALENLQVRRDNQETLKTINKKIEELKREINEVCDRYNKATEDLRKRLLKKADDIKKQKTRAFKDWQQKGFQNEAEVKPFLQSAEVDIRETDTAESLADIRRQCDMLLQQVKATMQSLPSVSTDTLRTTGNITATIAKSVEIVSEFVLVENVPPTPPALKPRYARAKLVKEVGGQGNTAGMFNYPWGVLSLPSGTIVISDHGNDRVQMLKQNLQHLRSIGGRGRMTGQFSGPEGLAVDTEGRLYVADSTNHRIQVLNQQGQNLYALGSCGSGAGQYRCPLGIAIDQKDRVYVCDGGNERVQVTTLDGRYIKTLTQTGAGKGHLQAQPWFVSTDQNSRVIITDGDGNVYLFDEAGKFMKTLQRGEYSFLGAAGTVTDPCGNILVADRVGGCVVVLDSEGQVRCRISSKGKGAGQMAKPYGVTLTSSGDLLVSDWENNKLMKYEVPQLVG